jgi:hypothetical protein
METGLMFAFWAWSIGERARDTRRGTIIGHQGVGMNEESGRLGLKTSLCYFAPLVYTF